MQGPASTLGVMWITVTPVSVSPLSKAQLIGRRAAILRQERTVEIDSAQPGRGKRLGGEDLAVIANHQQIGPDAGQALLGLRGVDVLRVVNRRGVFVGDVAHCAGRLDILPPMAAQAVA